MRDGRGNAVLSGMWLAAGLAALLLLPGGPARAKVVRIAVDAVERPASPAPDAVERIDGRAFGELDPADPANAGITDIQLAPRGARGRVEYVARFTLTKPADMARASGVLWYDLVNRGAPVPPSRGASKPTDFGHVALISGWQGDLAQTATNWAVQVPVAANPDGTPVTGPVLARLADVPAGTRSRSLACCPRPSRTTVGPDGNETAGVPSVQHRAPLGTYTGWNATAGGFFKGQPCGGGLTGGYVPFARTHGEREAAADPRPSLEERYGTQAGYMCAVRAAAQDLAERRFLLPADRDRLVAEAEAARPLAGIPATEEGRAAERRLCGG